MNYLKNAWYAAAWAPELSTGMLPRILLDQHIVFYRDPFGKPIALADRCPHRFAPLSRGKLTEGILECPYHGLQFNTTGACVHNPHGSIPAAAKVATFPLLEKHGMIWIWMGEAEAADPALLPDFSVMADHENYAIVSGYLHLNTNYELTTDNLLDLSHAAYLHPLLGNPDSAKRNVFSLEQKGRTVWAYNHMPGEPPTKLWQMLWKTESAVGDRRANMRWDPPSLLLLDVGFTECNRPVSEGASMPSAHILTPETGTSTHYFWAAARDTYRDDAVLSEKIRAGIDAAFRLEDDPMIAACQERMGTTDLASLKPILLKTDAAAGRARRILAAMIAEEQATQASVPAQHA